MKKFFMAAAVFSLVACSESRIQDDWVYVITSAETYRDNQGGSKYLYVVTSLENEFIKFELVSNKLYSVGDTLEVRKIGNE